MTTQPHSGLSADFDWTANESRKQALIEVVQSGDAVLMVGAGCSCKVRYPSWHGLLTQLENVAVAANSKFEISDEKKSKRPLEYVDEIKNHIRLNKGTLEDYDRELFRIFDEKLPFINRSMT